jgi:3-deoxy-7-phosphoheptulonate synthase
MSTAVLERHIPAQTPEEIVASLPEPNYNINYQPTYPSQKDLLDAIRRVQELPPVTRPEHVEAFRARCAAIAEGAPETIVMLGRCSEPMRDEISIEQHIKEAKVNLGVIAASGLRRVVPLLRCMGQKGKPRSNGRQVLPDGRVVDAYQGDIVNGMDPDDRTPDPMRMVRAAQQAAAIEEGLTRAEGHHVMVGHEALLLPYERASVYVDTQTGKKCLLSAVRPWIGVRTNRTDLPSNPHIDLLAEVENTVGVKIGPESNPEHIKELAMRLNPTNAPGKLVFMIRVGDDVAAMRSIVPAIREYAPGALIEYDIHGSTLKDESGAKLRIVPKIAKDILLLAGVCKEENTRLHGIALETIGDRARKECLYTPDDRPDHVGDVDPQLNPLQAGMVLEMVSSAFPQ